MYITILFSIILVLIILIIIKLLQNKPSNEYYDNINIQPVSVHPTHMPIYSITVDVNGPIPSADYTSVPNELSEFWKPLEPQGVNIIDPKIPYKIIDPYNLIGSQAIINDIEAQEASKELIAKMIAVGDESIKEDNMLITNEADFIKNIKLDVNCKDFEPALCQKWKHNNECIINPEFMLKNCPSACGSCNMSNGTISLLSKLYDKRPILNCLSHGGYSTGKSTANI